METTRKVLHHDDDIMIKEGQARVETYPEMLIYPQLLGGNSDFNFNPLVHRGKKG